MGNRKPPQGETETFLAHIPSNGFPESSSECKATCDKWHSLAELWGPPKGRLCPFPFTMHVIGAGQLNMKQLHCDNAHTWRQAMELLQQKAGSKGQRSCYLFISEEAKVVSTHTTCKACCGGVRGDWCKSHRQWFWKRSNTTGRQVWRCFGLCAWWVLREGDLNRCYNEQICQTLKCCCWRCGQCECWSINIRFHPKCSFVRHYWRQGKGLQVAVRSDGIWESMHKIMYLDYFPKCQRCIGRSIISRNLPKRPRAPLSYFFFLRLISLLSWPWCIFSNIL